MRVQLADSDQPHAQSAAVRFGGLGRRYVLVAFDDHPVGLLSHADGSGLLPEARRIRRQDYNGVSDGKYKVSVISLETGKSAKGIQIVDLG